MSRSIRYPMLMVPTVLTALLCACGGNSGPSEPDAGPRCGNGQLDPGEECDDGAANSDTQPDACRTSCQAPRCGDLVVDSGEQCDDANTNWSDGCDGCQAAVFLLHDIDWIDKQYPDVAADAEGNITVVWTERDLVLRQFDPRLAPFGEPQVIADYTPVEVQSGALTPRIAMQGDGHFAVLWTTDYADHEYAVYLERFDPEGVTLGRHLLAYPGEALPGHDLCLSASGHYAAVWRHILQPVQAAWVRSDGTLGPSNPQLGQATPADVRDVTCSVTDQAGLFVAWSVLDYSTREGAIEGELLDPALQPLGTVSALYSGATGRPITLRATGGDDAKHLLAYTHQSDGSTAATRALTQRVAPTGEATGVPMQVSATVGELISRPDIVRHPDGGYVVVWSVLSNGTSWVVARALSAAGIAQGIERTVSPPGTNAEWPSIAALPEGRFVVVWTERTGSQDILKAQRLDAELSPIGSAP